MPEGTEVVVETFRVDVPGVVGEIVTLVGFRLALGPAGETVATKFTVLPKLFWLVTVIDDVPDEP